MKIKGTKPAFAEVNMTPMIDIVFQLIAFFMVVTNFEQQQADERVKLAKNTIARPPKVKPKSELVLNIGFIRNEDGSKIDPDPFVFLPGEKIRVMNFGPRLEQEARLTKEAGGKVSDMHVIIRADAEVPTGLVQELVRMAREASFEKFKFKARTEST